MKPGEEPINDRSYESIDTEAKGLSDGGFLLHRYLNMKIENFSVNSVRGSPYIPTPAQYSNPKCRLINI